jgi:phospholipase/carboxylesterase
VVEALAALERPAAGNAVGALVLLHGRGADEHDLYPLLDALDPERRLVGYTPRGPLSLPPGGAHWYRLAGIPTPDPATFHATYELLTSWLDALPYSADRLVLGGFSQGAAMTYASGLGAGRPRPGGLICLSGFVPRVERFALDLENLDGYPVAIAHGTLDPVISVEWSREARGVLECAGADVLYRESPMPHTIDPRVVPELTDFVRRCVP